MILFKYVLFGNILIMWWVYNFYIRNNIMGDIFMMIIIINISMFLIIWYFVRGNWEK